MYCPVDNASTSMTWFSPSNLPSSTPGAERIEDGVGVSHPFGGHAECHDVKGWVRISHQSRQKNHFAHTPHIVEDSDVEANGVANTTL